MKENQSTPDQDQFVKDEDQTKVPIGLTEEQLKDIEENKDMAAISYVWILSLAVFYARSNSPFARYHAKQGVWLFFVSIVFWFIPFLGKYLEFIVLAGMIIGFINAAQGKYHDVPIVGQLASGAKSFVELLEEFVVRWLTMMGFLKKKTGVGTKEVRSEEDAEKLTKKSHKVTEQEMRSRL